MAFTQRTSLHGKKFGISSTGGLITPPVTGSSGSTLPHTMAAQMWGEGMHAFIPSTVGSTISNYGLTTMTSGSATSLNATAAVTTFEIGRPEPGVHKYIHIDTSASEITFGSTSTAIVFQSTLQGAGSTLFASTNNLAGALVHLIGETTARWILAGSTTPFTIG